MLNFSLLNVDINCFSGKGNEDKRGIPVTEEVYSKSWLYVNGRPVISNRHMEVSMFYVCDYDCE